MMITDPCSKCGGPMKMIPCPDGDAGCCVLHLQCDRCDDDRRALACGSASANRIPRLGGALPWRGEVSFLHPDSIKSRNGLDGEVVVSVGGDWRWMHRDTLSRLFVLLLCLLPLGGCQFIAYQHNDYRRTDATNNSNDGRPDHRGGDSQILHLAGRHVFPGLFGISPGIEDLARIAGPGVVVSHSAGAARAVRHASGKPMLLIDPWPPNLEVPAGVPVVYVVSGRPGRVTVAPGTRLVELSHGGGICPWAWTVGHVLACHWPESREAASMAAAQARMASAGSWLDRSMSTPK